METLALVISIISIVISAFFASLELYQNRRIHNSSLESEYFKEIYKDHLIKRIPDARRIMYFKNGQLRDASSFIDELNEIRRDSLYYQYNNTVFYDKLNNSLRNLEDYIVHTEDKLLEPYEMNEFNNRIQSELSDLYSMISSQYLE